MAGTILYQTIGLASQTTGLPVSALCEVVEAEQIPCIWNNEADKSKSLISMTKLLDALDRLNIAHSPV